MSHERIDEVLDMSKPGLAEWIDGEDDRLTEDLASQARLRDEKRWEKVIAKGSDSADVGEDAFMRDGIIGPLVDVLTDHAFGDQDAKAGRRTRGKRVRDPNVKWDDEIEALRAYANAQVKVRSGDIERIRQRLSLGASVQPTTQNREMVVDPWISATGRVFMALSKIDRDLLSAVHVEFAAPSQRRAASLGSLEVPVRFVDDLQRYDERETESQAKKRFDAFGAWMRDGRKVRAGEHVAPLRPDTPIEMAKRSTSAMEMAKTKSLPSGSQLQTDGLRWEHLLAEAFGMSVSGALGPLDPRKVEGDETGLSPEEHDERRMTHLEDSTRKVRAMYQAARKRFREGLLGVTVDVSPKWLIAAPTTRELDRDAADDEPETVECCAGVHVIEGLRAPCEAVDVEGSGRRHPSKAWRRCDVCERPVVEVRA